MTDREPGAASSAGEPSEPAQLSEAAPSGEAQESWGLFMEGRVERLQEVSVILRGAGIGHQILPPPPERASA